MASTDIGVKLNQLLKSSQITLQHNIASDEFACLATAFLPTNADVDTLRPKAYVVLSAICQQARKAEGKNKDGTVATEQLVRIFAPFVAQLFGETDDEKSLLTGAFFLTALFQIDAPSASLIFAREDVVEGVMDSIDLSPSPLLSLEIAHLLSHACANKSCREIIRPQVVRWLESNSRQSTDTGLRSAASLALVKLFKGAVSDEPEVGSPQVQSGQIDNLAETMTDVIVSRETASTVDAVEGLAYLTVDPGLKQRLATNSSFLRQLFELVPTKKTVSAKASPNSTLIYGISVIICNLTSFPPRLSEEQQQVEKLRRMAKSGKGSSEATPILDDDKYVRARIRLLISAGVLPVFPAAIAGVDSAGIRLNVGKSLLNIVEEKENRGAALQAGGARVLQTIIKRTFSSLSSGKNTKDLMAMLSPADLNPIQALAKLSITSSPLQVFGPNIGAVYDGIRPLSILLQHPSSDLLQRFEAIMALTNLASHSSDVASRVAKADGLVNKVELLLLEDHTLVRRASVELICNLIVGSDEVFERYAGDNSGSASKIHILLALSDVEDIPTRLAASGALATLTAAPDVCKTLIDLQFERHRFLPIMTQLIDPAALPASLKDEQIVETNPGLVHRGVACVLNVFKNVGDKDIRGKISNDGKDSGLLQALIQLAKGKGVSSDPSVMYQAAEALKALAE
jgi:hypothetical protein